MCKYPSFDWEKKLLFVKRIVRDQQKSQVLTFTHVHTPSLIALTMTTGGEVTMSMKKGEGGTGVIPHCPQPHH